MPENQFHPQSAEPVEPETGVLIKLPILLISTFISQIFLIMFKILKRSIGMQVQHSSEMTYVPPWEASIVSRAFYTLPPPV